MPLITVSRRAGSIGRALWRQRPLKYLQRSGAITRQYWASIRPSLVILDVHPRMLLVAKSQSHGGSKRCIHIPNVLLPPAFFGGLLVALWIWKCMMLVVFQNKIIYMPGLPPNARSERIADYARLCGGLEWREERTVTADGKDLALAVATVPLPGGKGKQQPAAPATHVYILYFQGNASSLPPRLPDLSWVLRAVSDSKTGSLPVSGQLTFVGLSYRGYWTSRGRPSEKGLRLDAEAGVQWIAKHHERMCGNDGHSSTPILLVWGQSIGCGVATNLAASGSLPANMPIKGLILETPFLSIRAMLETLYPQKWLPYKYLWPFLRNHMDSWANLGLIVEASKLKGGDLPSLYIIEAERDELVPVEHGRALYQRCVELGLPVEKATVPVAYHSEAIARGEGKRLVADAILQLTKRCLNKG